MENKGFWNGIDPITYQIVEYIVLPQSVPTYWANAFVFEVRQGILIKSKTSEFLIDNKYGDGYLKIASGGSPQVGHKSLDNYEIINFNIEKVNYRFDKIGFQKEKDEQMKWFKERFPEDFKKTQALLKLIGK